MCGGIFVVVTLRVIVLMGEREESWRDGYGYDGCKAVFYFVSCAQVLLRDVNICQELRIYYLTRSWIN